MRKIVVVLFVLLLFVFSGCTNATTKNTTAKQTKENSNTLGDDSSTLVVYFSVTNNTKKIAEYIKEYLSCDIFEIAPLEEYTNSDIDYNNDCRANREQNDQNARPKIKNRIEDITKYETIILGYPIWWGQAPKIMYTFIESYDLTGKTIIPFCTSGSSPIGTSATNLQKSALGAVFKEGRRFTSNVSKETVCDWINECLSEDDNMKLKIDNTLVDVTWLDNDSLKELKELAKDGLTINMRKYGGFEQVGSIGKTITSSDTRITTEPGDIVLYSSSQIVIFYGSNTWEYTKLGHINLPKSELTDLLGDKDVVITLK